MRPYIHPDNIPSQGYQILTGGRLTRVASAAGTRPARPEQGGTGYAFTPASDCSLHAPSPMTSAPISYEESRRLRWAEGARLTTIVQPYGCDTVTDAVRGHSIPLPAKAGSPLE